MGLVEWPIDDGLLKQVPQQKYMHLLMQSIYSINSKKLIPS